MSLNTNNTTDVITPTTGTLTVNGAIATSGAMVQPAPTNVGTASTYTVTGGDYSIRSNIQTSNTLTVTLPTGPTGRLLNFFITAPTGGGAVNSASGNIVPINQAVLTNEIVSGNGKWTTIQFNGTNWNVIATNYELI